MPTRCKQALGDAAGQGLPVFEFILDPAGENAKPARVYFGRVLGRLPPVLPALLVVGEDHSPMAEMEGAGAGQVCPPRLTERSVLGPGPKAGAQDAGRGELGLAHGPDRRPVPQHVEHRVEHQSGVGPSTALGQGAEQPGYRAPLVIGQRPKRTGHDGMVGKTPCNVHPLIAWLRRCRTSIGAGYGFLYRPCAQMRQKITIETKDC